MKNLLCILIPCAFALSASAQDDAYGRKDNPHISNPHAGDQTKAYTEHSVILRAGIEFPSLLTTGDVYSTGETSIPISAALDIGVSREISIRGYVGYCTAHYLIFNILPIDYTFTIIGAGATYHFKPTPKFDPYAGLLLAYNNVTTTIDQSAWGGRTYSVPTVSSITYSAHIGANYYMAPNFGVYGEVGYGISILKLGLCLKF